MADQSNFFGTKNPFSDFINNIFSKLFSEEPSVEGQVFTLPGDSESACKIEYEVDEKDSSLTIKIVWNNDPDKETKEETKSFTVLLPAGLGVNQLALGADQDLCLGRRVSVVTPSGTFAPIANTGAGCTCLDAKAQSGDIVSVAPVVLRRSAQVTGDVTSGGTVKLSRNAVVTGQIEQNTPVPLTSFSWSVDFPASTARLIVYPCHKKSAAPGAYTRAVLYPYSSLSLTAGTYFFDKLDLKPGSDLILDTTAGPISIYVRTRFVFCGRMRVEGPEDRVLIGYAGTLPVVFETPLNGTFVAPEAPVRLKRAEGHYWGHGLGESSAERADESRHKSGYCEEGDRGAASVHRGAVFGKTVEIDAHVQFIFVPFSVWNSATLTVRTFLLDETAPDQKGGPAGEGVYIRVNGRQVGITGPDGILTTQVPPGTITVQAVVPSFSQGEASLTLAAGASGVVDIVLDDGKEVIEPTTLVLIESVAGVLPNTSGSFTLRFEQDGVPVALERVDQVELLNREGDVMESLDSFFGLSGGELAATDVAGLLSVLQPQATRQIALDVTGMDALGFTHSDTVHFHLGQFRLAGTLTAPPSNPALNIANLTVEVTLLGTTVVFTRVSDADGRFEIASVPIGNIGFDSQTLEGGMNYYGQGTLFLSGDRAVSLVMRSVTDVVNGVPPLTSDLVSLLAGAALPAVAEVSPETAEERAGLNAALPQFTPKAAQPAQEPTASVSATAAQEDVPVSDTASLTVPQGTQTVTLTYNVFSFEYPVFVLMQSVFNDVWSLAVYGGQNGQQLFELTRNVNSQVSIPPIWQGDSSTGDITRVLDVSALTAAGDAILVLSASATNIGDSNLATIVNATLSAEVKLTINEINADAVEPTTGDSTYYSIPRPGDSNVFERWFTLGITKPAEAVISRVRVILQGPGDLMILFDEGPGPNVQIVDDRHLRVRVSMNSFTSAVNSTPPPASDITYRFRVQADLNGQMIEDTRDSGIRHALWRMPGTFQRYGKRDIGLDDWCSRGCYLWLEDNAALITRIDDICGEHARNIGHNDHARGVDIDMFHYYTFPGGVSGGGNYSALLDNVAAALNGDAAAAVRVAAWVTATRAGLSQLLARSEVNRLYYTIGTDTQYVLPNVTIGLNTGWSRSLIRTGSVTTKTGETLDTGLGAWSEANNSRMQYNATHNSHIHIALNSTLLQN